jgi:hypothetical protein
VNHSITGKYATVKTTEFLNIRNTNMCPHTCHNLFDQDADKTLNPPSLRSLLTQTPNLTREIKQNKKKRGK